MNETLPLAQLNLSDPKIIETIRKTVAVGADDVELAMFLELAKSAGLNPFKRELWLIKAGNRAQIMVGLNGYLKIANLHPQFDGMEITLDSNEKGELLSATCKVHRKDRKYPSTGIALMKEYRKSTPIWSQMPSVMLGKVAKCIAIREAFPLETAGTYAEEEMPPQYAALALEEPAKPEPKVVTVAGYTQPGAKRADDIPDWLAEHASNGEYTYDLTTAEPDIKAKAIAVLQNAKAHPQTSDLGESVDVWVAPKELKKLERFYVGHTETAAA